MDSTRKRDPVRGRAGRMLGELLLNLAALGGAVCLVLVILAFAFDITLMMFRTGSMAPTIPAGSVALARQIDAAEIRVGDVVTVDRRAALPVTHRVTSISGTGDERVITMRGDANATDDPHPYTVTKVRRVIVSVPGVARPLNAMSDPRVLAAVTVAAAALVTWAFWPRGPGVPPPRGQAGTANARPGRPRASRRARRRLRLGRGSGTALLAVVLIGLGSALPGAAGRADAGGADAGGADAGGAAAGGQRISGEVLRLEVIGDPEAMTRMSPGSTVPWQVGIWAEAPSPGTISVSWSGQGDTRLGLLAGIRACGSRWISGECPGTETVLVGRTAVPWGASERDLWQMGSDDQLWLLVEATLSGAGHPEGQVELRVHARGLGDDVHAGTGQLTPLPSTGARWGWYVTAALAAILLGVLAAAIGRTKGRRS